MVPGGRVELPTPAFSGPRSTGELPRHRGSKRFYGRDAGVSIKDWISSARRVAQASACVVLNCDACCFASEKQKSKTHRLNSVLLISSTRRTRASNLSPSKLRAALFHRRARRITPSPSYLSCGGALPHPKRGRPRVGEEEPTPPLQTTPTAS